MTPLTPPQNGIIGSKEEATAKAEAIVAAGGLAWVEAEYGNDMGRENVFWGYRVKFFPAKKEVT